MYCSGAKLILNQVVTKLKTSPWAGKIRRQLRGQSARHLAASKFFDQDYYSIQAGRKFSSRTEALKHYALQGEAEGLKPSPFFNPIFYRSAYPDIAHSVFAFAHFHTYGANEGRLGAFDLNEVLLPGARKFDASLPTVAVITHELSATGAPILAWNIINNIPETWNVICISIGGGQLEDEFSQNCCALINLNKIVKRNFHSNLVVDLTVAEAISKYKIEYVISNSVVSEKVATCFTSMSIPVATLIHEFASYIPKENVLNSILYSDHVAFSSKLTLEDAEKKLGFTIHNASVLPQGKSIVPINSIGNSGRSSLNLIELEKKSGKFIVIGCGHVQIRKGVDLFIAGCDRIAQILGVDNVHFVWVGNGYSPDTDYAYSIWLKDQVERSSLNDCFSFIPGLCSKELDHLYSIADVMFLSSRLDPLPNVAIDAVSSGIPVVCFEKATGLAEYFDKFENLANLIVPYLDVQKAAEVIVNLLKDPSRAELLQQELSVLAETSFSMDAYVNQLLDLNVVARERREALACEVEELMTSGLIDPETFQCPSHVTGLKHSVDRQLRLDRSSREGVYGGVGRPFSGFSPHIYHDVNNLVSGTSPTVDWLRKGRPEGPWLREVVNLQLMEQSGAASNCRVAIHIHAHYNDQLSYMLNEISLNDCMPDIFISSSSLKFSEVKDDLADIYAGKITFIEVPNSGRDIGPMLTACAQQLINYDVVGHIHTKKSLLISDRKSVDNWVNFLLQNCIGSRTKSIDKIIQLFAERPQLGLCFPEDPNIVGWTENLVPAKDLAKEIGLLLNLPKAIEFPVGNMFYFRPEALKPLFDHNFTVSSFPAEPLPYDGTMLHALERLLPLIVEEQGFEWITTRIPGVNR